MSTDTKAIMKEMREDIKAEKFLEAIEKGKAVLKVEPRNYMCHLLMGAAYQNFSKTEARKHLREAIACCETVPPTIAYQGLAKCSPVEELPKIYEELLKLAPEKYSDYYAQIYRIAEKSTVRIEILNILRNEASKDFKIPERRPLALKYLAKLWSTYELEVTQSDEEMYKTALEELINDSESHTQQLFLNAHKRYLKLLYKRKEITNLLKHATYVVEQFPTDVYALEWICKIYCENYGSEDRGVLFSENTIKHSIQHYAATLLELNSDSGLALLVKAIDLYVAEQYVSAYDLLYKVQIVQPNYSVALNLLAQVEMKLEAYDMAIPLWQKLNKVKTLEYAICLSHSNQPNELREAVELLESFDQTQEVVKALARCFYKQKNMLQLSGLELDINSRAEFLMEPDKAIDKLQTSADTESFETLMLLGKLNIELKAYPSALNHMLKATRLQPYRSTCFFYLGCIYYAIRDTVRARKCFEKCVNMNPAYFDAVQKLSAIYQDLKEDELNVALLVNSLNHMNSAYAQRIHYKLGLHYLNSNKWDDAIHSFRAAIKFQTDSVIYWETLGDAYAARGSYHSAIRVFQKVLEMNPSRLYPNLRLALLKTTLRMYQDAIIDFDKLLLEHPYNLPGLKGAAEANIGLAYKMKLEHRYRCCKFHLQLALNHLQTAFLSQTKHNMVWLWRMTANVFIKTARMPNSLANLEVSGKLVRKDEETTVRLERCDLLKLASQFYICAVKLKPKTFMWYELALCYYYLAVYISDNAKENLDMAEKACKMAIEVQKDYWQNWNLLGVISMHKENDRLEFAQNCFVQALNIDRKSYTTWTNLGVLYLRLSDIKLANQAFKRAQQSSPVYGSAWIGQAMIAEAIAEDEEALDLFRHCLQFEYHPESSIGYAHWICKELTNVNKAAGNQYRHAIEKMFADVVALDAINWYTANEEDDSSIAGLSFQAFLDIRQKLYRPAVRSYLLAIKKATPGPDRDKILTNLGYLYMKLNEPNEAIEVFHMVTEATFKPIIGLALAYFRAEQHQESYMVFSSVLKSLGGEDDHKAACIIVAMSAMLYASQGEDDTKSMLKQCLPLKDAPIQAVYSTYALGIVHKDNELTESMLKELHRNEGNEKYCADIAFLIAQYHLAKDCPQKALNYIVSRVHIFPHSTQLRLVLADFLKQHFSDQTRYSLLTSQMALGAIDISHRDKKKKNDCVEDARCLLIASHAFKLIDENRSKKLIQRAVHLNPQDRNAWSVLMAEK